MPELFSILPHTSINLNISYSVLLHNVLDRLLFRVEIHETFKRLNKHAWQEAQEQHCEAGKMIYLSGNISPKAPPIAIANGVSDIQTIVISENTFPKTYLSTLGLMNFSHLE